MDTIQKLRALKGASSEEQIRVIRELSMQLPQDVITSIRNSIASNSGNLIKISLNEDNLLIAQATLFTIAYWELGTIPDSEKRNRYLTTFLQTMNKLHIEENDLALLLPHVPQLEKLIESIRLVDP